MHRVTVTLTCLIKAWIMGQEVRRGLLTGEARVRFQKLLLDKATLDDSASISFHQSICHQRSVSINYLQDSTNTFTKQASVVKTLHIYIYIYIYDLELRLYVVLKSLVMFPAPPNKCRYNCSKHIKRPINVLWIYGYNFIAYWSATCFGHMYFMHLINARNIVHIKRG